ncbi:UDP-N-acetylmuramoyl-L-alanyl-D-glutamate--2,6-diaminopimelate ligase [Patescibacteria group bacterium]|nr:UDP-N-acetylmuramoyl-L-alanyl-D-glutamate--2,6-diaminopimelate ligase [Patescibacteria group bacterium]
MKNALRKIVPQSIILQYHKMLALLAAWIYGHPSKKMTVIGITGTDGKTTTTILTAHFLDTAGKKTAYLTTAEFKIGDKKWINDTKQTMPGRFKLQKFLKQAVKEGCTHVVVETSSQGIEQSRHLGINYDVAVFTNLSPDHLEAHGSFERYKAEKEKLFKKISSDFRKEGVPKISVVNVDDAYAVDFLAYAADKKVAYTLKDRVVAKENVSTDVAIVGASSIAAYHGKTSFDVTEEDNKSYLCKTPLIGTFNVANTLAALSVARSLGASKEQAQKAAETTPKVPGRLEIIDGGQPFMVVVDYAHAQKALEEVLKAVTPYVTGRLISVLGSCGGGRDVKKRPTLGKIAATYADIVVVTNEDPYDEDPMTIIKQVSQGALDAGKVLGENCFEVLERKEGIKKALSEARSGDVVLITGKGSEQCIVSEGGKKIPWDDRKVARELLHEIIATNSDNDSNK